MESTFRQGIIYSLTAYLLWGILPIYWKTLGVVQAFEILSNRFIWSCVFVWILIIASGRVKSFLAETQDIFTNPKQAQMCIRDRVRYLVDFKSTHIRWLMFSFEGAALKLKQKGL